MEQKKFNNCYEMLNTLGPGSSCGDSQILLSAFDPVKQRWSVNLTNRSQTNSQLLSDSASSHNRVVNLQNYFYQHKSLGNGLSLADRKRSLIS